MRINQYLAYCLGLSRRKAEEPVLAEKVRINGQVVTKLFTQVGEQDQVEILDGKLWRPVQQQSSETIMFYKPTFCVSTRSDPENRRTVYDLLPNKYKHLKSAGRLDFMSEGLLVLSTDGGLLQELTHPRFEHTKLYLAGLNKPFDSRALTELNSGQVELEGYRLNRMQIKHLTKTDFEQWNFLGLSPNLNWYFFELSEGRNLQIRKLCSQFGTGVARLIRVKQGQFQLTPQLQQYKVLEIKP